MFQSKYSMCAFKLSHMMWSLLSLLKVSVLVRFMKRTWLLTHRVFILQVITALHKKRVWPCEIKEILFPSEAICTLKTFIVWYIWYHTVLNTTCLENMHVTLNNYITSFTDNTDSDNNSWHYTFYQLLIYQYWCWYHWYWY